MSDYRIPFNRASLAGNEFAYAKEAIERGHISGDGVFTRKCHAFLEQRFNAPRALLTTSCTHALEMAALLLDLQPGDEVIVPAFTFVSTVNAFALRGARPVFADIRPDTLNMDETRLESLVGPRTRAIVPVHYAGVGCEMDAILGIARKAGAAVVEDNAHGFGGAYRGRSLGTFGCLSTLSFHETKNVTCGEGGALIINDEELTERAEIIREKGTNRSRFLRGEVDKYTWVGLGSSYLPSDILAAFLFAQLERLDSIQAARQRVWERYYTGLHAWACDRGVRLPVVPRHCDQTWHMFYLILPSLECRQALINHLKRRGILAVSHYQPLHLSDMGRGMGGKPGDCPVTESVCDRLLRLPVYGALSEAEQCQVIGAVEEFEWQSW